MHARRRNKVLFVPGWRGTNPYLDLLAEGLGEHGTAVTFADFPKGAMKLNRLASSHPTVGTIHIHWIPDLVSPVLWAKSLPRFWVKFLFLVLDCLICKLRGVRLVWTIHNLISHESLHPEREVTVRRLLFHMVDAAILHSDEARREVARRYKLKKMDKARVIPHGHYIGLYKEDVAMQRKLQRRLGLKDGDIVLLFFGAVRRYKGLEWLIPVFHKVKDDRYRLIIAGGAGDPDLKQWLDEACREDPRISLCLGFVPDEEVASYFHVADAVILPFQRTLTSGSAVLAMSMGKCLLLPEDARVLGMPGDDGALYFADEAGLAQALQDLSRRDLSAMGAHNLRLARQLDWGDIAARTAELYGPAP